MRIAVSIRATLGALTLLALHVLAHAYVQAHEVLYDQGGLEGLLWFLVNLWVLPLLALATLIVSIALHLKNQHDREY